MESSSLRHLGHRELALHLRQASKEQSAKTVSKHLLEAIDSEALPPTVFRTFLTSVKPSSTLKDALRQQHSKHVRHVAIEHIGKALKGFEWEDVWQELGGTEGLLDLFSRLSVSEVKHFSQIIGRSPGRAAVKNDHERQRRVTELLQCLMYPLYPSSPYKSKDQRSLYGHYAQMVPACTSEFVEDLLRQDSHPLLLSIRKNNLVRSHFGLLRQLILEAISLQNLWQAAAAHRILEYIPKLLLFAPSDQVAEPRFSASMSLAVAILETITAKKIVRFPERFFMQHLMNPLMRRLQSHKVDPNRVQQIVRLVGIYLRRHEGARAQLSLVRGNIVCYIANYWSRNPLLFEGCLVEFISLLSDGSQKGLFPYRDLIRQVATPHRYDLLRIVCLHSAAIRVNIEVDDELQSTKIERWPIFIFKMLQRDHSTSLLQRLIQLKPEANFLELCQSRTILSQPRSPNSGSGDPGILLSLLQPDREGAEHEAVMLVEALKSKASKSREQSDRAFFAKSAAFNAIASGSLKLYGDVLQWTRRFLRDALTVKTVYSQEATLTTEGIALLKGFPEDLDHWTTAKIRTRVTQANDLMLVLLETAVLSLREPSFYANDWRGPLSLFGQVIMSRMSDESRLKRYFKLSEDEFYHILWPETIKMLLQAEETGLKYEALGFNSPHGPLGFSHGSVSKPALSFYRFLGA